MKRKIALIIYFFLLLCSLSGTPNFKENYKIFDAKSANELSLEDLGKKLMKYDVIFFGEWHDDVLLHALEAQILPFIYDENLVLSMEMFERDTQSVLNDFLEGKIEESEFLEKSRAWGNYKTDYKPIISFAKKKNLPVLAANVPRRFASAVSKKGPEILKTMRKEKHLFAEQLSTLDNQYKKQFMETMKNNMGNHNAMGMKSMLEHFYAAQCLKDDTMAESINKFKIDNKKARIIHYNGNFHSESWLGTANKIMQLNPDLNIAVITPVVIEEGNSIKFENKMKSLGDFIIAAHRFPRKVKEKSEEKMFKDAVNSIENHRISLKIKPEEKFLAGYDEIQFSHTISVQDTLFLMNALVPNNVFINQKPVPFNLVENENYNAISLTQNYRSKKIKIQYEGEVYFPLKGRDLNQTHDGTKGIISGEKEAGIYLPGASWYPFLDNSLAIFDITVSCPKEFQLLTSGKETKEEKNNLSIYNWKTELPVAHISLVGNRFEVQKRMVGNVELRTYLLPEDARFSSLYLDAITQYLNEYTTIFGEYPFSSFSVVENFFASGFGMPNYTLLAKEIVKMPFVTLSPGVIAHEFCHNWWGNSVYVDYENGNWCEALTVFSSNYYQNILKGDSQKAEDWRKKAILENNLLPNEKQFPLNEFIYQHNNDDAVIGYQKGAMLFVYLFEALGEDAFFEIIRDFYKENKGKVASWSDIRSAFKKSRFTENIDIEALFHFWLNSIELPELKFKTVKRNGNKIRFQIEKSVPLPLTIPIVVTLENGKKIQKKYRMNRRSLDAFFKVDALPKSIEIDPQGFVLKGIPKQSMPYNLNQTLNDSPLIILPSKGDFVSRLNMVSSMLSKSGYDVSIKSDKEVTKEDLQSNSLLILGEFEHNLVYDDIQLPTSIQLDQDSICIGGWKTEAKTGSAMLSFGSSLNDDKSVSIYTWNSELAIQSFRKMFHYMNDSWQIFDISKEKNKPMKSGMFYPKGQNPMIIEF